MTKWYRHEMYIQSEYDKDAIAKHKLMEGALPKGTVHGFPSVIPAGSLDANGVPKLVPTAWEQMAVRVLNDLKAMVDDDGDTPLDPKHMQVMAANIDALLMTWEQRRGPVVDSIASDCVPVKAVRMRELSEVLGHPKQLSARQEDSAHDALVELAAKQIRTQILGPSGDGLGDFEEGQWWLLELDAMASDAAGNPDKKRAVAVVRNLLATLNAYRGAQLAAQAVNAHLDQTAAERPTMQDIADKYDDKARLDFIQEHGATIEILPAVQPGRWVFRVNGQRHTRQTSVRDAIDAAKATKLL